MKTKCLIVDDIQENLTALEAMLLSERVEVYKANSGDKALDLLLQHDFAFALLDVQMPIMGGLELAEFMRGTEKTKSIPIIFVTADPDKTIEFKGYESGAVDVLYKPLNERFLLSKVKVFIDLHEKGRSLQVQLEKAEQTSQELRHEQKLRERFISMLAHDLRTPLAATKITAQMLLKMQPSEKQTTPLKRIISSIARADNMISDLLDASRIEAGKSIPLTIENFELMSHLRETIEELKALHGDRFKLTGPEKLEGSWSRDGIRRVIENLASNAVKYGRPDGVITIGVEVGSDDIHLTVHNQGNPLSAEEQSQLFRQYHRSTTAEKSGEKGWGIGLTLVKGIAESLGGKVSVKSSASTGTTFTIIIPR